MRAKPFLIGFLAVIVAAVAVSIYISRTVDKADKSVTAVASPDGKYKAVRVSLAVGGAAPFCFDTIAIFLSVYPDNFAESDKTYEVYGAPCTAPDKRATLPKIEWLSDSAVKITYAASTKKPRMQTIDASKFVHVTFAARE